ncbi:hypothetical protein ACHZ97_14725 [Lysobacter soli]|uniref:hypothetical protein n=1 Tax=Lysobacter soli TaxID=453783 RepID=UPI0037CAF521
MAAMYGHTWTSAYGDNPSGLAADTWATALSGLTAEQLAAGLRSCVAEGGEFPPSAPRFRAMCFGIPSFEAVNHELLTTDSANRTAFARLVWSHIDGYAHRHARADDAKRMRQNAYDLAREQVMRGEPLPEPAAGEIEHQAPLMPQGIPTTREGRIANLARLLKDDFHPDAANRTIEELNASEARREAHRVPRIEEL